MVTKAEIKRRENKMATQVLARSPAGNIEPVANLKKRQLAVYYRPVKDDAGNVIDWVTTRPLPADFAGRELYLSKGFRLTPPGEEPVNEGMEALLAENARLKAELDTKNVSQEETIPEPEKRKYHKKA